MGDHHHVGLDLVIFRICRAISQPRVSTPAMAKGVSAKR